MKKTILSALIPIFMATSVAFGGAMISFNDNNGTPNAGTYNSTDTFSFDVNLTLTGTTTSPGYSLWLEVPNALASSISITSAQHFTFTTVTDQEPMPWNFTDSAGADSGFKSDQSATQAGDLGATGATQAVNFSGKVETISFSLTNAPAGTYTLESTVASPKTSEATDNSGGGFADAPFSQTSYVITVVPEPATLSLLGLGGLGSLGLTMLRARRRKA